MADIAERNKQKVELASLGYSLKYIDEWQPKTTLYRHKPGYNEEGVIVDEIGTTTPNVPGSPDYVLRKSRIGLFPWPPSDGCVCRWGTQRREASTAAPVSTTESTVEAEEPEIRSSGRRNKGSPVGPYFNVQS